MLARSAAGSAGSALDERDEREPYRRLGTGMVTLPGKDMLVGGFEGTQRSFDSLLRAFASPAPNTYMILAAQIQTPQTHGRCERYRKAV